MRRRAKATTAFLMALVLTGALGSPVAAAAPDNDSELSPKIAKKLPYNDKLDATEATESVTDPSCRAFGTGTVWYQYTAKRSVRLVAETFGSDYNTLIGAYDGKPLLNTNEVGCNDDYRSNIQQSRVSFQATAGRTYNFVVSGDSPGLLVFTLRPVIPPPHDDLSQARNVQVELPFEDRVDTTDATLDINDPSCRGRARSVWYRYERPREWTARRVMISTRGSDYETAVSVYTGSRNALNQIECKADGYRSRVRFLTEPGETYWVMVSAPENRQGGLLKLTIANMPFPFRFDVDVKETAPVSEVTGETHVSGYLECNKRTTAVMTIELKQKQPDGHVKYADDEKSLPCGEKRNWSVSLISNQRPFQEGPAGLVLTIEIEERERKRTIRKVIDLVACRRCM
ncbi:MAG TPA: hypothetical protein VE174_10650 [Actinomycetota bacterium]|nr:hypothetical protein [Actinomycetota bacterium]